MLVNVWQKSYIPWTHLAPLVDDCMVKRSPFVTAQEVKNSLEYVVHETYPKRNWVGEEEQSNEKPLKIHQKWWQVDSVEKYRTAHDPKETFSSANNGAAAIMIWTLSRIVTLAFSERCNAESRECTGGDSVFRFPKMHHNSLGKISSFSKITATNELYCNKM